MRINRFQQILIGVLIVQVALSVFLLWPHQAVSNAELLLGGMTKDQVVSLTIADGKGVSSTFARADAGWVLPDRDNFPADSIKLEGMLDNLAKIKMDRLVTQTVDSQARLKVAADDFATRVTLNLSDGSSKIIYLGTQAGVGANNVRLDGDNNVYLTNVISSYEVGANAGAWIDTTYLQLEYADMSYLNFTNSLGVNEFQKGADGSWTMSGLVGDETFNPNNLTSMLNRLAIVSMAEPLGKENKAEYGMDAPLAVINVRTENAVNGSQDITLTVGALNTETNQYYLKSSASEYYVTIPNYSVETFITRSKVDFLTVHSTPTP
jgi:hypothetical protein